MARHFRDGSELKSPAVRAEGGWTWVGLLGAEVQQTRSVGKFRLFVDRNPVQGNRVSGKPYFLVVDRSATQVMSRRSEPTEMGKSPEDLRTGRLVVAASHFLISEWPSANEKPQAPL